MISVDEFAGQAAAWLADHAADAPPDYGAICPPELLDQGVAWHREVHAAGFAGIHWPGEVGGHGLTPEHHAAWLLEAARAGVPAVFNMVGLVLTAGALLQFGTESQRQEHLPPTARADRLWCQLFSEPGAGSDLAALSTRAELDGDLDSGSFVVDGQKVWCSGGRYSDWGILLARTRAEGARHDGISLLLVPMDLPGIEIRPLRQMTGATEFDEVFLTGVRVPAGNLVGPLHGGWGVAMSVLTHERGHIGTAVVGLERRLGQIAAMADAHRLDAIERQRLSSLLSRGHAMRALAARRGAGATASGSLLKLGITELGFDAAMVRGDLGGATSLLDDADASGMLAAPGGRIAGGTSQVQRNIIGERLLGLPREPRDTGAIMTEMSSYEQPEVASGSDVSPPWKLIALVIVLAGLVTFFFQNGSDAPVHFLWLDGSWPVWSVIGISVVIGIVLDRLISRQWRRARRRKVSDG